MSPDKRVAVFTIWEDGINDDRYNFIIDRGIAKKRPGESDLKMILELTLQNNSESFGLICYAKDTKAVPRSIDRIDESNLVKLEIKRNDGHFIGLLKEKIPILMVASQSIKRIKPIIIDAKNPLMDIPAGFESPDRASGIRYSYERDDEVRKFVLLRANGRCEYCGKSTFVNSKGINYLESHHIIALANKGKDTVDNVIALCPDHHREAHFGARAASLEDEFIDILKKKSNSAQQSDTSETMT